jgi:hypothetical protein
MNKIAVTGITTASSSTPRGYRVLGELGRPFPGTLRPKTVQTLLRNSDVKLTLQFYAHAVSRDRMVAAGKMVTAIFSHAADQSGLKAD